MLGATPHDGTVTFLFTDVEGSTKLWEAYPDVMRGSVARHDELIRVAIEAEGGQVFKTIGDAFCAAFATAPEALAAGLAGQLAITAEAWPEETPIKVRMALHAGAVEFRDSDYFGQPLNRTARLLAVGHGGQTLVSRVAYDLCRDNTPGSITFRELGEHRLKDLGRMETIFQLIHPNLPKDFPALRSLNSSELANNLPQQITSLIGREKEVEQVKKLVVANHLVTLTGSGGCGKTRLSVQVAADMLDSEGDGVWLVELASLTDPALVVQAAANVLGVKEEPGKAINQTLLEWLKRKRLLIVLDNCEHLLEECAKLADAIIRSCPDVRILASSREALGISGEQSYRVPSLETPHPKQTYTIERLSQYASAQLFLDRARMARPDFEITNANAPALVSLCHHLDGIPLAIELAAARVRALSVEEINDRLHDRFRFLTGGSRTALPRQQTLRALIDWSYDLLSDKEKILLRRLSVFSGGWTLEAAEAVCSDPDGHDHVEVFDVLDMLGSLVDKNLVVTEVENGRTRYRLLETVRQYARDRLSESGESAVCRNRHLSHFVGMAEEAQPHLRSVEPEWIGRLEIEHDNLRTALDRSLERDDANEGLRLAVAIWRFWWARGHFLEGHRWMSGLLAAKPSNPPSKIRAKALGVAGYLARQRGDYPAARLLIEESLAAMRELGDQSDLTFSLQALATTAHEQGDFDSARVAIEESLAIERQLGNQRGIAHSLMLLGVVFQGQSEYLASKAAYEESLAIHKKLGNQWLLASLLTNFGQLSWLQGDYASAQAQQAESLAIFKELGLRRGMAAAMCGLGLAVHSQGDSGSARELVKESLAIFHELADGWGIAMSLEVVASLAASVEGSEFAARVWGAAERLREVIGSPRPPNELSGYCREVESARAALGADATFDRAWQEGRALTADGACEFALQWRAPRAQAC